MTIRLIDAARLGHDLAAGRVTAREQSLYLVVSFLIWVVPAYLFLFSWPRTNEAQFFWWIWLIELGFIVLFYVTGVSFCLRKCRVDPKKNFLVDFSCLYAPISLTTLIGVWGGFHLLTTGILWLISGMTFEQDPVRWFPWLGSARVYDVLRMFASVAAVFIVFLRIGEHMSRISTLRESANSRLQSDAPQAARA
jgi:cation transport ATPase